MRFWLGDLPNVGHHIPRLLNTYHAALKHFWAGSNLVFGSSADIVRCTHFYALLSSTIWLMHSYSDSREHTPRAMSRSVGATDRREFLQVCLRCPSLVSCLFSSQDTFSLLAGMDALNDLRIRIRPPPEFYRQGPWVNSLLAAGQRVLRTSKALGRKTLRIQHMAYEWRDRDETIQSETVVVIVGGQQNTSIS